MKKLERKKMQVIEVKENEAGQRLDKLLAKYLNLAPKGFLYKMLRKKNILLNKKKADGSEKLEVGDTITLFLAEETIQKFSKEVVIKENKALKNKKLDILYEDKHILLINKPSGILSQKANQNDISLVEMIISYLLDKKERKPEDLLFFRPSVCNRLDRNTSGIVVAGKSLCGLQMMSSILKDRSIEKYYLCLVNGKMKEECLLEGYLVKDKKNNQVTIKKIPDTEEDLPIQTQYTPIASNERITLLKVKLITGRSHQIRAHLAFIGHSILGDEKYGIKERNLVFRKKYGIKSQMLHSYQLIMPEIEGELAYLSKKKFYAPLPEEFKMLLKGEGIPWQHGIQED